MPGKTGIFKSTFTGSEAFLADHKVQGKRILPGMAYIEMARAAVAESIPLESNQYIRLKNVTFLLPIAVEEKNAEIEIHLYPGNRGEIGIEVKSEKGIHFQTISFIESLDDKGNKKNEAPLSKPKTINLDSIEKRCNKKTFEKDEIYQNFKKAGLDFGSSHQGIQNIKVGKGEALAKLYLPNSHRRGMLLDPGMLDSSIQGGALIDFQSNKFALRIPFAIKNVYIYGALEETMVSHLIQRDQGADIKVATDKGEIKVEFSGFASREVDLLAAKEALVYFEPKWESEKIEQPAAADKEKDKNKTIFAEEKSYENLVEAIFKKAKDLINKKITEPHTLEVHLPKDKPEWRGIIGLLKTIKLEHSKIDFRLQEGDQTLNLSYQAMEQEEQKQPTNWPANKTILITGGTGKLGLIIAEDIAKNTKGCTLILTGRSEFDKSKKETLASLEKLGVKAKYQVCDIEKASEVNKLFKDHPKINGIIHSAGLILDNFIPKKTPAEIQKVLGPKVKGIQNLDTASANLKLDYFIAFSSIAGTLGNAGQADYSAGNGYMDSFIHQRANLVKKGKRSGKSISINWPLWESGGMNVDKESQKQMETLWGIRALSTENGLTAMKTILGNDKEQVVVLYGKSQQITNRLLSQKSKTGPKEDVEVSEEDQARLEKAVLKSLMENTAKALKIKHEDLDETAEWSEFGFDSILLTSFSNDLNATYDLDLMPTVFFEASTMETFSKYLVEHYPEKIAKVMGFDGQKAAKKPKTDTTQSTNQAAKDKMSAFARRFIMEHTDGYRDEDMAIVGVSCRFPKAEGIYEFWNNLKEGKDCVDEIPADRWNWQEYPEAAKWGAFIDGIDQFDSLFFGISPAEAAYISPEQRLLMEYVWKCLEDAGYAGDSSKGTDTGIFVGVASSEYSQLIQKSGMPIEGYSSTGMVPSVGPNRISYLMDWHGPSEPIETACSSSLVAIHRAVEAIRLGNCSQAIAGGVNLLITPNAYISFTKAGMLCEDGRCKTFSKNANGYVRGEGVGMIMIKPLEKAIQEGDHIYGIIKGTAENHGGRTNSLTAPNPKAQSKVIQKAILNSGIIANDVSYVECHGTGTSLGDPVEINGLKDAFHELGEEQAFSCGLGSVKSNMGHLEMAAGIAGIIKVLLQMKHKTLVKSLHCEDINPYIKFEDSPFFVVQKEKEWTVEENKHRIAGVSSFGFGGVNAHVILQEYVAPKRENLPESNDPSIVLLSAKNEERLKAYANEFLSFFERTPKDEPILLQDLAYTLQVGRDELEERVALVVKDLNELKKTLSNYVEPKNNKTGIGKVFRGTIKHSQNGKLLIEDTNAGKKYIQELVVTKEYEKLAELWVRGTKINWEVLYQGADEDE